MVLEINHPETTHQHKPRYRDLDGDKRRVIVSQKCGQMGNRIIAFAHLIAMSTETGIPIFNPHFKEFSRYFKGSVDVSCPVFSRDARHWVNLVPARLRPAVVQFIGKLVRKAGLSNSWVSWVETVGDTPDFDLHPMELLDAGRIGAARDTFLFGWRYRCYDLFHKHEQVIRDYFTPVESILQSVDDHLAPLRVRSHVVVGVHVRHGDYRTWCGGKYFYEVSQYAAQMRRCRDLFGSQGVSFLVCSNAELEERYFEGLDWIAGPGGIAEDMAALSRCDYLIGPPSTFSRWASFMGRVPLCVLQSPDQEIAHESFVIAEH